LKFCGAVSDICNSGVIALGAKKFRGSPRKFHGYSVANFLGEQKSNFAAVFSARHSQPTLSKKSAKKICKKI
jgi:hypothetical protein